MSFFPKGIFVTGTDTGVGKTVVSAVLAWILKRSGRRVAIIKPVQTGTNSGGLMDIEFIQRVIGENYTIDEVCPYRFPLPLAPSVASYLSGEEIDLKRINSAFHNLSSNHDVVIVEGAGGLLVPITDNYLMSDLACDLGLHLIIVTRPSLGTLNHTLLTVESAKHRGLRILGIVINKFPLNPEIAERTNPELILKMTGGPIVGVLPFDPGICVEEGRIGRLREIADSCFSPDLGGSFILGDFLSKLRL
ncbi:MAG: dethiobiotin synthase [Candidatus Dadabacteria bacterium]